MTASTSPAGAHPFVPHSSYWCGGAILKRFVSLPTGWVLASAQRPADSRLVGIRVFRTAPEGERIVLHRYLLKADVQGQLAHQAAALMKQIRIEDNQALVQRERRTLHVRGTRCRD
jgi:hypothetical protein